MYLDGRCWVLTASGESCVHHCRSVPETDVAATVSIGSSEEVVRALDAIYGLNTKDSRFVNLEQPCGIPTLEAEAQYLYYEKAGGWDCWEHETFGRVREGFRTPCACQSLPEKEPIAIGALVGLGVGASALPLLAICAGCSCDRSCGGGLKRHWRLLVALAGIIMLADEVFACFLLYLYLTLHLYGYTSCVVVFIVCTLFLQVRYAASAGPEPLRRGDLVVLEGEDDDKSKKSSAPDLQRKPSVVLKRLPSKSGSSHNVLIAPADKSQTGRILPEQLSRKGSLRTMSRAAQHRLFGSADDASFNWLAAAVGALGLAAVVETMLVLFDRRKDTCGPSPQLVKYRLLQATYFTAPVFCLQMFVFTLEGFYLTRKEQPMLLYTPLFAILSYVVAATSAVTAPRALALTRVQESLLSSWLVSVGCAAFFLSDLLLRALATAVPLYALGAYLWLPFVAAAVLVVLYLVLKSCCLRSSRWYSLFCDDLWANVSEVFLIWRYAVTPYPLHSAVFVGSPNFAWEMRLECAVSTLSCSLLVLLGLSPHAPHPHVDPDFRMISVLSLSVCAACKLATFSWCVLPAMSGEYLVAGAGQMGKESKRCLGYVCLVCHILSCGCFARHKEPKSLASGTDVKTML